MNIPNIWFPILQKWLADNFTENQKLYLVIDHTHLDRQGRRGGQAKLRVEDQLLVALEYWREDRSEFHIGVSWGLHETPVGQMVRKVEELLVKCGKFRLPSQRQLYQPGWERKVMLVDVGEIEIEGPKKNRNATIVASSAAIG